MSRQVAGALGGMAGMSLARLVLMSPFIHRGGALLIGPSVASNRHEGATWQGVALLALRDARRNSAIFFP